MNEFQIVVVINRPVPKVFSAMNDLDKAPNWNPAVAEVRRTDDGPIKVGSTVVYVGKFLDEITSPRQSTSSTCRTRGPPQGLPRDLSISKSRTSSRRWTEAPGSPRHSEAKVEDFSSWLSLSRSG